MLVRALALVAQRFTATRSARQDAAGDVDRGLSPLGLTPKPDGDWLVAFAGSDELALVSPQGAPTRSFDVARAGLSAPHSVVALAGAGGPALVATSPSSGHDARGIVIRVSDSIGVTAVTAISPGV